MGWGFTKTRDEAKEVKPQITCNHALLAFLKASSPNRSFSFPFLLVKLGFLITGCS